MNYDGGNDIRYWVRMELGYGTDGTDGTEPSHLLNGSWDHYVLIEDLDGWIGQD